MSENETELELAAYLRFPEAVRLLFRQLFFGLQAWGGLALVIAGVALTGRSASVRRPAAGAEARARP